MLDERQQRTDDIGKLLPCAVALQAWHLPVTVLASLLDPAPALDPLRLALAWVLIPAGALVWWLGPSTRARASGWRLALLLAGLLACVVAQTLGLYVGWDVAGWLTARDLPLLGAPLVLGALASRRARQSVRKPVSPGDGALTSTLEHKATGWRALRLAAAALGGLAAWQVVTSNPSDPGDFVLAAGNSAFVLGLLFWLGSSRRSDSAAASSSAGYRRQGGWVVAGLGVAILLAARLAQLQGVVQPLRVSGVSMLPHWMGEHFETNCPTCSFAHRTDATYQRVVQQCPNCQRVYSSSEAIRQPGDRALIDRWPWHTPRRWQVVALRDATRPDYWELKRVVGLPGERPGIVGGDLYVDGRVVRKTLDELRACAVLVHDDRFSAASDSPRWQSVAEPDDTVRWQEFAFAPLRSDAEPPIGSAADRGAPPIPIHPMRDVLMACDLSIRGSGRLIFVYEGAAGRYRLDVSYPERAWTLSVGGMSLVASEKGRPRLPEAARWEFAVYDERLVLAVDGRLLVDYAFPLRPRTPPVDGQDPNSPAGFLRLGYDQLAVATLRRQVFRDLYYLAPDGTNRRWQLDETLGIDELLVLGDHPSASTDGRQKGPIALRHVLGPVIRWRTEGAAE